MSAEPPRLGPYVLLEDLPGGSVSRARHEASGRLVALKRVAVREPGFELLKREAHLLRRLSHPGIVRIVEVGADGTHAWYASDLVDGPTLRELFAGRTTPARDLLGILAGVCRAIAYLHARGIVHRDLHPGNVVVRGGREPVIVDFGLAARFPGEELGRERLVVDGAAAGTVACVAPEQLRGEPVDGRADVYAVGCMLHESLSGQHPFARLSVAATLRAHLLEPPPPLPSVPGWLADLAASMLRKDPALRPGSAGAIALALAEGAPTATRSVTAPPHLFRARLHGRDALLASIEEGASEAAAGRGGMVMVEGASGLGRTRLLVEAASIAREHHMTVLASRGEEHGASPAPLAALRPAMRALAALLTRGGPAVVARLSPATLPALRHAAPELDGLTGAPPATLPPPSPLAAREAVIAAALDALVLLSRTAPLAVLVDDLHRADDLSRDILDRGIEVGTFAAHAILVVAARDRPDAADERAGVRHLDLLPLSPGALGLAAADMLGVRRLDPDLASALDLACGSPLLLGAQLRRAAARGSILIEGDLARRAPGTRDPERATVEMYLGSIGGAARRVLEAASVLGRSCHIEELVAIAGVDAPHVPRLVSDLVTQQVLDEGDLAGHVVFRADALQRAVHDSVPSRRRARLHRRAASHLALHATGAAWGAVGRHLEHAGSGTAAAEAYLRAGAALAERYSWKEGERLLERAAALAPRSSPTRARAELDLARSLANRGELERARRILHSLGRRTAHDPEMQADCRAGFSFVARMAGKTRLALRHAEAAARAFADLGDAGREGGAWANVAILQNALGKPAAALELHERAHACHRRSGNAGNVAASLANIGSTLHLLGRRSEARGHLEEAIPELRRSGDRRQLAAALRSLAALDAGEDRLETARTLADEATAIYASIGDRTGEAMALLARGDVAERLGELAHSGSLYRRAASLSRDAGSRPHEGRALGKIGRLALRRGEPLEAIAALEAAIALTRSSREQKTLRELGQVLAAARAVAGRRRP